MPSLSRRFGVLWHTGHECDPRRFRITMFFAIVNRVLPFVPAIFARFAISAASDGDYTALTGWAIAFGLSVALYFVTSRVGFRSTILLIEKSGEAYDLKLMRAAMAAPLIDHFETPEYLDRLERLRFQPGQLASNGTLATMPLWAGAQLAFVAALLWIVNPVLLALPAIVLASLWFVRKGQNLQRAGFVAGSQDRRVAFEYFTAATSPNRADEVRALQLGPELVRRHHEAWQSANHAQSAVDRRAAWYVTLGGAIVALATIAALWFVVEQGIGGEQSAGDIVLVVVVIGLLYQQLSNLLDSLNRLMQSLVSVNDLLWVIDHAATAGGFNRTAEVPASLTRGITLDHVDLTYPGRDTPSLHHVDLHLAPGTIVALVGENGAGKTTLTKLLTGMYHPTAGRVLIDGIPLENFGIAEWRAQCSAAFQDCARLELIAREAIGVGDLNHLTDSDAITRAAERSGAAPTIDGLPDGMSTPLGSSLDGQVLSGGQWQRVALGRAMMRETPLLLVFDEPTASLDPDAEQQLFERYADHARRVMGAVGGITILVTHRFSSVRIADHIVVLEGGTILEHGTHDQLITRGGTYAELYELQARSYR